MVVEVPVIVGERAMSHGLRSHLLAPRLKESRVGAVPHPLDCGCCAVTFHQGPESVPERSHCCEGSCVDSLVKSDKCV